MQGTYEILKKAKQGYEYNNGFYTYGYESNRKRAISIAKTLGNAKVRKYLTGKIIFEQRETEELGNA